MTPTAACAIVIMAAIGSNSDRNTFGREDVPLDKSKCPVAARLKRPPIQTGLESAH